ncbi:hypothetical protein ACHAWX_005648 [Stephanocyclus meneghinianus]
MDGESDTARYSEKDNEIMKQMRQEAATLSILDVRVVVMSATLDVEVFQPFFPVKIPGKQFPVQEVYTESVQEDYIDAALKTTMQIHKYTDDGDALIFLPGQDETEDLASLLKTHLEELEPDDFPSIRGSSKDIVQNIKGIGTSIHSGSTMIVNGVLICVLYVALPPDAQMVAFCPKPNSCSRKIILLTNIAETSVTLDGIKYVVDCGKHKSRECSSSTGMESLKLSNTSKAQAAHRIGRAGRVSKGVCLHLYPEIAFDVLEETAIPEILQVNLSHVVLQLKAMGIHDPRCFSFLTPPDPNNIVKSFELLSVLGAVDKSLELTPYGKEMSKLPLDPVFAHLLLQSEKFSCVSEMLTVVGMSSAENIFFHPGRSGEDTGGLASVGAAAHRRFASHEGDLPSLVNVYNVWKKEAIYYPPGKSKKSEKKKLGSAKMLHDDSCKQNFISGRALA